MKNLDIILNTSIVSYFKTDNPLVDGFILMIIGVFSSYLFSKKNKFIKKGMTIIDKCLSRKFKYSVKLLAFESTSNRHFPKIKSSIEYNSVNFCIKNKLKCKIKEITQNYDSFKKFNKEYKDGNHMSVQTKVGYDISQSDIFHIKNDIYGIYQIEIEEDEKLNNSDNIVVNGKKKYLVLKSNVSMKNIYDFIDDCIKTFDIFQEQETNKGPFIFSYKEIKDNSPIFEEKYFRSSQTLGASVFDNKQKLINAINKFTNDDYYKEHTEITRKLIPLFYGEPGTGKTFAIRLLAKELKRNIISVQLNKIKSLDELNSVFFFNTINEHKITPEKCIFVIEDLDAMTELLKSRKYQMSEHKKDDISIITNLLKSSANENGESNSIKESTLTMSDVLNILDGLYTLDNYVIVFSTNHIEKLDPAFLRDQRITHKLEFKKCSKEILILFIEKWYKTTLSNKYLCKLKENTLSLANIASVCDKCDTLEEIFEYI